jgi:hypothetical protein
MRWVSSDDLILGNTLHDRFWKLRWLNELRVIGVLGILAFIFSVVSPYDDAIQQEFIQGKNRHFAVQNWKSTPCASSTRSSSNQQAVVSQGAAPFYCFQVGLALNYYVYTSTTVLLSRPAGRSPPAASAY